LGKDIIDRDEELKPILVVFTGGTIGSRAAGGVIDVAEEQAYELLQRYAAAAGAGAGVRFETRQPLSVLSENLNPAHWQALIGCLADADPASYAGVIVTHGSDTLPYTSAMLGYVFADTPVPIVLVAANYPLDDERSNGVRNFAGAVDFIRAARLPGVYAVYANMPSSVAVHIGTRLMEALPFTDTFDSAYAAPLGWMENGVFRRNDHPVVPAEERLRAAGSRRGVLRASGRHDGRGSGGQEEGGGSRAAVETPGSSTGSCGGDAADVAYAAGMAGAVEGGAGRGSETGGGLSVNTAGGRAPSGVVKFSTDILYIRPYPGLDYGCYAFGGRKPRAVLHGVYHSATANSLPAEGYRSSLTDFAAYCREQGVDLYAAPAKNAGTALYQSADTFMRAGVRGLRQMTVEAALVKLMLAYGMFGDGAEEARDAWLAEPVFFEIHEGGSW